MSWRRKAVQEDQGDDDFLRLVLEHYGVRVSYRAKQMVSCPLHGDDTPSMSVNLDKGAYKCHSCGAAGGGLQLIKQVEGVDSDRARQLAADWGCAAPIDGGSSSSVRDGTRFGARRPGRDPGKRDHGGGSSYTPSWRRT